MNDFFQTFICYSTPSAHPFISERERDYLEQEINSSGPNENLTPTPWKAIFTSMPMIALICAQIGHDWGFYIMVSDLPKYMADVMQFSIKANGVYSSLPYVSMWIISISSGFVGDWLMVRSILNITNTRKLMTAIGKGAEINFKPGARSLFYRNFRRRTFLLCSRTYKYPIYPL